MISMSSLFRYNLKTSEQMVPLARELEGSSGLYVYSADAFWKPDPLQL